MWYMKYQGNAGDYHYDDNPNGDVKVHSHVLTHICHLICTPHCTTYMYYNICTTLWTVLIVLKIC